MQDYNFIERIAAKDLMEGNYHKEECIINPNILRAGSRIALAGGPKAGKSYFLLHWMAHMAAGVSYMGMKPVRPMKVLYIQTEIEEPYFKERLQSIDKDILSLAKNNLTLYLPDKEISLDEHGVKKIARFIKKHLKNETIDIIAIDAAFFEGCLKSYRGKQSEASFSFKRGLNNLWKHIDPMVSVIFSYGFDNKNKTLPDEIPICDFDKIIMRYLNYNDSIIQLTFDIFEMMFQENEVILPKTIKQVDGKFVEIDEGVDYVKFA